MQRLLILLILSLAINFSSFGQYPFDKFPAIKYQQYKDWQVIAGKSQNARGRYKITIPKFFNEKDDLTIVVAPVSPSKSTITLYHNEHQMAEYTEPLSLTVVNMEEILRVADINGDKLADLKLIFYYPGKAGEVPKARDIYLFQNQEGFTKVSFANMHNMPERDFDGDGNYEIICMSYGSYKGVSCRVYNLYNFNGQELVNVDSKHNYPLLLEIEPLKKHNVALKTLGEGLKDYEFEKPEGYSKE